MGRREMIDKCFNTVDKKRAGILSVEEVTRVLMTTTKLPTDQVAIVLHSELMQGESVTLQDWQHHFRNLSTSFESDDAFCSHMSLMWDVPFATAARIDELQKVLIGKVWQKAKGGSEIKYIRQSCQHFDGLNTGMLNLPQFIRVMEQFGLHIGLGMS